jgi:hypothetical protein
MDSKGYFTYGGRTNEAEAKFYSGECAMLTSSSAAQANINRNASSSTRGDDAVLRGVAGAPQNSIIGGASLWVMAGKKPDEYKGVAKFLNYLADPQRQALVAPADGIPADHAVAYDITKTSGFYEKNPGTDVSVRQMMNKRRRPTARACASAASCRSATMFQEEFENMLAGKQDAKDRTRQRGEARQRDAAALREERPRTRAKVTPGAAVVAGADPQSAGSDGKNASPSARAGCRMCGRAATRDHDRLLLLAGEPGDRAIGAAAGSVRHQRRVRRASDNFVMLFNDAHYRVVQGHGDILGAGRVLRVELVPDLAVFADRAFPLRRHVQDAADLAVRGRARGRRGAVAVPVQPDARHRRAWIKGFGVAWDPLLVSAMRWFSWWSPPCGTRSRTTSVLPRRLQSIRSR